jgi:3-oxoacyl-[acyl-carrier protein] reductase
MSKRNALVTGASKGIGKAIVKRLLNDGCRVLAISRSEENLRKSFQEELNGDDLRIMVGDISDPATITKAIQRMESEFGSCDILVNNNGGPPPGNLEDISLDEWKAAFNYFALPFIHAIQAVLPGMKSRGFGRIITIGSISVIEPIMNLDLSNFIRAGFLGIHKSLSQRVAADGICVHMVNPGAILTERSIGRIQARADDLGISYEKSLQLSQERIPKGDLGSAEDVANAVSFLASDASGYLTALSIQVDGGMTKSLR